MSGDVNFHISGSVADAKERMFQAQGRNLRSMVLQGDQTAQLKAARKAVKPSTLDQLVAIRDKAMERAHHELDKFTELGLSSLDDATAAAHLGRAGVLYDLAGQLAGVITNIRQEQEK